MPAASAAMLRVNGWTILFHPLFLDQIAAITTDVERAKARDVSAYKGKACSKRLAAILKLAFEAIPHDPASPAYQQGRTLGTGYTHWRRAKFFQQYRLYFRYDQAAKMIIYAWVNDDNTKRAYGQRSDAYAVFAAMLRKGNPPDDWAALKSACEAEDAKRSAPGRASGTDEIRAVQNL